MREAIKTAIQEARNQAGYNADDIKMATLALVGFPGRIGAQYAQSHLCRLAAQALQEELFGIHMAGEIFFRNLEQLMGRADSADLADLLEVHYLCLLLGYGGRYSIGGKGELQPSPLLPESASAGFAAYRTTHSWRSSTSPKW